MNEGKAKQQQHVALRGADRPITGARAKQAAGLGKGEASLIKGTQTRLPYPTHEHGGRGEARISTIAKWRNLRDIASGNLYLICCTRNKMFKGDA